MGGSEANEVESPCTSRVEKADSMGVGPSFCLLPETKMRQEVSRISRFLILFVN